MTTSPVQGHILVVDDDPKVRLLLRRCFEPEGYGVSEAADGAGALAALAGGPVDLITLDLNLGADDGLMLAREIRAMSDVPIIMVTGKGDVIDRVVGLELGADDYIAKPFHVREVLARVKTVIRRNQNQADAAAPASADVTAPGAERYGFNGWTADFSKLEVLDPGGSPVSLTTGEMKLLEAFVTHPGRVLSRDQLMDLLKGYDWSPTDRSIDNQIARLRKKIETAPKAPKMIKTVRGAGYSFTADVTQA